ncbi:radical SAM family heme chaperone HemW [Arcticibacter eurypsychrophilus]|uniref:radical SAM family heme chaperone HemW n=1 Tax=Arcticibacter eurypsychrophilus TaxID=1434752 RepID=UPI0009F3F1B3|nr:radical SAM family heme chaperone HemW [Arcticibacter eurypsychrophilus]
MAGIYFHIPFCKQACHYCDFHFSTSKKYKDEIINSMLKELELQKEYLGRQTIETIYFGGGTPSILTAQEIQAFIDRVIHLHPVASGAEISMETNPDDLTPQQVKELKTTDINRFSIGIQSFFEEDLKWMNRAHNAKEADSAVKRVQDAGFENITLDLIYGYPLLTDQKWKANLDKTHELNVPHISAYSMTVESKTALAHFIKKGKQPEMNDNQSAEQFLFLIEQLKEWGYEHYETSNFAKPNQYSRHNTNYWRGVSYLGIGPSAHSFNGEARKWNIANNAKYLESLLLDKIPAEMEILTQNNRVNEYIMTSLRTMWGMDLSKIDRDFGSGYSTEIEKSAEEFLDKGWIIKKDPNTLVLTDAGMLFSDHIASELFIDEERK